MKRWFPYCLTACGEAVIVYSLWLMWPPAAVFASGAALVVAGLFFHRNRKGRAK
jgi:hypothetical protein